MDIINAEGPHYLIIQHIAKFTWPEAFGTILSDHQIEYMLELMYSESALMDQVAQGHHFLLAIEDGTYHGFASYELNYEGSEFAKVHKLYILPKSQGKSVGRQLLKEISNIASANNNRGLTLNVNRKNPAVAFYQNLGWTITREMDIDIDNGYFMNDYVMELNL